MPPFLWQAHTQAVLCTISPQNLVVTFLKYFSNCRSYRSTGAVGTSRTRAAKDQHFSLIRVVLDYELFHDADIVHCNLRLSPSFLCRPTSFMDSGCPESATIPPRYQLKNQSKAA